MKVDVTYIIHSCFTVEFDDEVLLFDYPRSGFSTKGTKRLVESKLKGKNAFILSSHSHGDHFTADVFDIEKAAEKAHFVLSDDIILHGKSKPSKLTMIGPQKKVDLNSITIETFESNDAGVAFLIKYKDKKIYYGGDLAMWDWPEWSSAKRREHVEVFEDVLNTLKEMKIHIAFSNMDKRLKSWAGPKEFIKTVKPTYFIPMHTFGNEGWIEDLVKEDVTDNTEIFKYERPGDSVELDI